MMSRCFTTDHTLLFSKWILNNDYESITSILNRLTIGHRYGIVSKKRLNGQSLIHYASYHGRCEILKYFVIECLANVNSVRGELGLNTIPLFIAIRRGDYAMVNLLVKLGANLSWQNLFAENAIVYACKHQQLRIGLYLKRLGCRLDTDRNVLLCAQSLRYCLSSLLVGTSVNATDSKHDSIFILASEYGTVEVLKLLLYNGVDVHYKNRTLDNALSAAIWKHNIRSYTFLLRSRVYTKIDRALAMELCGAKMILFQSQYQDALDTWTFSIILRLRVIDGISEKLRYYRRRWISPIKEFRSVSDISRIRTNVDACIEQAHLVYTRIRDISVCGGENFCE